MTGTTRDSNRRIDASPDLRNQQPTFDIRLVDLTPKFCLISSPPVRASDATMGLYEYSDKIADANSQWVISAPPGSLINVR